MKSFREQFTECKRNGFTKPGKFISFEHHPEMLPFCPTKRKKMLEAKVKGFNEMSCGRFGGSCSSGHPACRKLRGHEEMPLPCP
jgi:hypothetical protein